MLSALIWTVRWNYKTNKQKRIQPVFQEVCHQLCILQIFPHSFLHKKDSLPPLPDRCTEVECATSKLLCVIKAETHPPPGEQVCHNTLLHCSPSLEKKSERGEGQLCRMHSTAGKSDSHIVATCHKEHLLKFSFKEASEAFIILGRWWEFHFDIKTQSFYFNANADATDVTAAMCLRALESQAVNRTLCRDHNYCASSLASMQ